MDLFEVFDERLAAFREHERVARVVDVFARAGEVHEFGGGLQFVVVGDAVLDPVFDGLDVVVRRLFDRLDGFAVFEREVFIETAKEGLTRFADAGQFFKARFGEGDEPFDFDAHAGVHEGVFGEDAAQSVRLTGIAAVDRGKSGKSVEFHLRGILG